LHQEDTEVTGSLGSARSAHLGIVWGVDSTLFFMWLILQQTKYCSWQTETKCVVKGSTVYDEVENMMVLPRWREIFEIHDLLHFCVEKSIPDLPLK